MFGIKKTIKEEEKKEPTTAPTEKIKNSIENLAFLRGTISHLEANRDSILDFNFKFLKELSKSGHKGLEDTIFFEKDEYLIELKVYYLYDMRKIIMSFHIKQYDDSMIGNPFYEIKKPFYEICIHNFDNDEENELFDKIEKNKCYIKGGIRERITHIFNTEDDKI